jgi:hypothetical protein
MPSKVWISTLVAIAGVMACGVATAQATVVDRGSFDDTEANVPDTICGIDVIRTSHFSGTFRIRAPKDGGGEAFLQRLTLKSHETFVNPANGRSMSIDGNELINELHATLVSGTVYEFETIESGRPFIIRDSAGRVVVKDRGSIRSTVTFDTLGDGQPGGIELDVVFDRVSGPHPGFDMTEEEFCGVVEGLIG